MRKNKKWIGLAVLVLFVVLATIILRNKIWNTKNSISESGLFAEINNDELVYIDEEEEKVDSEESISNTMSSESLLVEKTSKDIVSVMEGKDIKYSEIYNDNSLSTLKSVVNANNLVNLSELFPDAWKDAEQPSMGEYNIEPKKLENGFRYSKKVYKDGTSEEIKENIENLIDSNIETIDGIDYIDAENIERSESDNSYGYLKYYCERIIDFAELDDLKEVRKTNPGGKYTWIPDSESEWRVKSNEYTVNFTNFADSSIIATASIFVEDGKVSYIGLNGFDSSKVDLSVEEDTKYQNEDFKEDEDSEEGEEYFNENFEEDEEYSNEDGEEGEVDESIYE